MSTQSPASIDLGIDIGSTTTKYVVLDTATGARLASGYKRHNARQAESVAHVLDEVRSAFPTATVRAAVTGSGSAHIAQALGAPYIQEVVANAVAVQKLYPQTRCAIELGGQDAKMVFFRQDPATGRLDVADMRMNGSCAGGTGAFIDEIATLLKVPTEEFDSLASQGKAVYDISGRCGVYAKTDIQPLLNQGVPREDIALSSLHAIAKQTIGGLAQGLDIEPPVIFEGGPLTFNPTLVRVFCERLNLTDEQAIRPEHPETIVALGTAYSLSGMFADAQPIDIGAAKATLAECPQGDGTTGAAPLFASAAERAEFEERHAKERRPHAPKPQPGDVLRCYLGIDSGSTTTKFALINEAGELVDEFYAPNEGQPLDVARDALIELRDRYAARSVTLTIIACGTTGYGELMFQHAFHADYHTVETVAHAAAATAYVPDASFILDIGGQDMKAIWLDDGIISDIVVNEACSSGCGSFLENFASTLGIPTHEIARAAFDSQSPAQLGSRCTVFMNSSIVSEQRNGRTPEDIMAGLCRSIIENVFTKVVRIPNTDVLGDKVVVQGGTFNNDAVLRALELYIGKNVIRAPFPGLMGAIGAALLTKRFVEKNGGADAYTTTFIGLHALDDFFYTQQSNLQCPFCANHCNRTLVTFSDGTQWVTGNRCPRGEVIGDPKDAAVRNAAKEAMDRRFSAPNLFDTRRELLFANYDAPALCESRGVTIGLPRVLSFWDTMPFWSTFWKSLGFGVKLSRESTRALFESGLPSVTSDTVCFPAKLVHGHIRDLARAGVDRIFMPIITTVPSENMQESSESMCAVVKGYPMVIRNSDNPQRRFGVEFDDPLFHWYTDADRERQLVGWMQETFGVAPELTKRAIEAADAAQKSFKGQLLEAGGKAIADAKAQGRYAVVLASRPYHNDSLVNHELPEMFAEMGLPVLPPDAVPGATEVDLHNSRLDIVNNYHARMLGCAVLAAQRDELEFVQLVSFGCGHDAYLSDEIVRIMREVSGKTPLILKVDESDVQGPLRIRVRSFVETVDMRREMETQETLQAGAGDAGAAEQAAADDKAGRAAATDEAGRATAAADAAAHSGNEPGSTSASAPTHETHELADPYPVKFTKADRADKVVLVPNTSHAFSRLMASAFAKQGIRTVPLPIGREEAIRLGKKYVHNDICFPAQIVIGEALAELESGKYDLDHVAVATGKYVGDCRLTHYAALLRKALDDAGYAQVPIITNDDTDTHNQHPGFKMNAYTAICIAGCLPMIDVLEELVRKMRPYELDPGASDAAFEYAMDELIGGLDSGGLRGARAGFSRGIERMRQVRYDRSNPRPTVLIVGEYLLNFHPGANHDVEEYLEKNGLEIIEARMTDVIRKTYFYKDAQAKEFHVTLPFQQKAWNAIANKVFDIAHSMCDKIACRHPLYTPAVRMDELVVASDPIMHHTFDAGEGVLIPGEILHHAEHGCRTFLILQPFGCLPNHVCGRGVAKRLKEMYPDAQILPLDYDPDVSFANVENRLQMLVMNALAGKSGVDDAAPARPSTTPPEAAANPDPCESCAACVGASACYIGSTTNQDLA